MFQRLIVIFVLASGCSSTSQQNSFILPTVETHPEERQVHDTYPIVSVLIEELN
jgi:hypothetical protein